MTPPKRTWEKRRARRYGRASREATRSNWNADCSPGRSSGDPALNRSATSPSPGSIRREQPVGLALLPIDDPSHAAAYLSFYGAEGTGRHEALIRLLSEWHARYRARLVANWGTMLQFAVDAPPDTLEEAFALAVQHVDVAPCTTLLPGETRRGLTDTSGEANAGFCTNGPDLTVGEVASLDALERLRPHDRRRRTETVWVQMWSVSFALTLARLPATRVGRVAMGVVWAAAVGLASASDSRSLGVMAPLGLIVLLHGWATLTNWGGTWDRVAEAERRRYERGRRPSAWTIARRASRSRTQRARRSALARAVGLDGPDHRPAVHGAWGSGLDRSLPARDVAAVELTHVRADDRPGPSVAAGSSSARHRAVPRERQVAKGHVRAHGAMASAPEVVDLDMGAVSVRAEVQCSRGEESS